jgi:hypothetical protein
VTVTDDPRNPAMPWVIGAVTLIVVIELVGALLLSLHNADSTRFISACAIITAAVVPSLFAIVKIGTVETKVDAARENTDKLLNGALTARIHDAVHTVLESHGVPQTSVDPVTGTDDKPA